MQSNNQPIRAHGRINTSTSASDITKQLSQRTNCCWAGSDLPKGSPIAQLQLQQHHQGEQKMQNLFYSQVFQSLVGYSEQAVALAERTRIAPITALRQDVAFFCKFVHMLWFVVAACIVLSLHPIGSRLSARTFDLRVGIECSNLWA